MFCRFVIALYANEARTLHSSGPDAQIKFEKYASMSATSCQIGTSLSDKPPVSSSDELCMSKNGIALSKTDVQRAQGGMLSVRLDAD